MEHSTAASPSSLSSTSSSTSNGSGAHADAHAGRILIVDDVAANVRLLAGILKVEGYQVATASSGPEALEAIDKLPDNQPDVILLDVMMPGMNGFEVCRRIRQNPDNAALPVVMVTALQESADRVQALEAGADDFLTKPVDEVEVVARVKSLVRVKRQREALDAAYRELKKVESMRDSLTAMLVHDLRTPLTTIIGPLEMLQTGQFGKLDDMQREIVAMSTRSGYRLLGLVNELLDVSKMESGDMTLRRTALELPLVVREALEQVATLNQTDTARVLREFAPDLPIVQADQELLRRVIINLVGNALKFTPGSGTVTISARLTDSANADSINADGVNAAGKADVAAAADGQAQDKGAVLVSVTDTGEGIPPEDRERIFEKFGQVESRKAGLKMSTGLGLTFCKLAVEAHGGRIWVESTLGEGSTFFFTLPL